MLGKFVCFWFLIVSVAFFLFKLITMVKTFQNRFSMTSGRYSLEIWLGGGRLVLSAALMAFFAFGMIYGPGYWLNGIFLKFGLGVVSLYLLLHLGLFFRDDVWSRILA